MRFRQSGRAAHPSLSPSAVPSIARPRRSRAGTPAAVVWCALIVAALAVAGSALADPQTDTRPKASSFAPRHTKRHVYGAPVSKPVLHKRKSRKSARPPAAANPPAEPIK